MTIRELRELLDRVEQSNYVNDDTEVTVFGVGHGLPLILTGEWSKPPSDGGPLLLHSRVNDAEAP